MCGGGWGQVRAGAGRGQLGVWQTDKLWTQPQGVQVSPPAGSVIVGLGVVSCWQSLWVPPPQGSSTLGDTLWPSCVSWEWQREGALVRALMEGHLGASRAGDRLHGPHPACCLTLCCSWPVGLTGHSSQLACSVGQVVPLLHPEWPGFWGNHLPFGSYKFHHRSCGSGPQGPPWACW